MCVSSDSILPDLNSRNSLPLTNGKYNYIHVCIYHGTNDNTLRSVCNVQRGCSGGGIMSIDQQLMHMPYQISINNNT